MLRSVYTHKTGFTEPYLACDTCGERIEDHGLAVVQVFRDGAIRVVHKSFDGRTCDSKHDCILWMPLDVFLLHLLTNLGYDGKKAEANVEGWALTV